MNATIQKLMDRSFTDEQGERFDPERFAELIVKECAVVGMVMTDDHFDVDALYRHFGIES
jgi:hypothetical protein